MINPLSQIKLAGIPIVLGILLGAVAWGNEEASPPGKKVETAIFAGGCFWCMEEAFESQAGVISVESGYTGGTVKSPDYDTVSAGGTGHAEAIRILYDPEKINYRALLSHFWKNIDPTVTDRQFCDFGNQYRAAIFYRDNEQKKLAEESKTAVKKTQSFKEPIVTEIVMAAPFYQAEGYHQNFYKKNPFRYKAYKWNCGRAQRLRALWGE
jgi:peptide-methionine (S)-S-oxide reductase